MLHEMTHRPQACTAHWPGAGALLRPAASGAQDLAAHCGLPQAGPAGLQTHRLRPQWPQIVGALAHLGEVACTVGQDDCGLTRTLPGLPDSGLDMACQTWCHGYAVQQRQPDGSPLRSLQFFGADGPAVVKFVLTARSVAAAFSGLVEAFGCADTAAASALRGLGTAPPPPLAAETLRQAWASLRHPDAAAVLFSRLGVPELQVVQGLGGDFASPLAVESAQELLSRAAQAGLAVAVCGRAGAAALRWSGPFRRVDVVGAHVMASAPDARLHWHEDRVASAWLVKTPSSSGLRHALALFDHGGDPLLRFEAARQPGRPEHCQWRELLCSLSEERQPCRC